MIRVSLSSFIPALQLFLFIPFLLSTGNFISADAITDETGNNLSAGSIRNATPTQRQIARYKLWQFFYSDGSTSSKEATYFFSISAIDLSSQANILIEASWWGYEYLDNSVIDFVVLIKDPADRLIDNHTVPYGTNGYTTSFAPNTKGVWRVVLAFEGTYIPTASEPHDAYIAIDYRVTVSGVNTGVGSYVTEKRTSSSEPQVIEMLPFADSAALGAAYWFLVHSSGNISPRTLYYDHSLPNPIEKIDFIHYPTEKALSVSFSETECATSGYAQIEDPYIGFWKMEIEFRSDRTVEFVLWNTNVNPANLYLIPDDGAPPFVDEDCDGVADLDDSDLEDSSDNTIQSLTTTQDTKPSFGSPGFEWIIMAMGILMLSIRNMKSRYLQYPSH